MPPGPSIRQGIKAALAVVGTAAVSAFIDGSFPPGSWPWLWIIGACLIGLYFREIRSFVRGLDGHQRIVFGLLVGVVILLPLWAFPVRHGQSLPTRLAGEPTWAALHVDEIDIFQTNNDESAAHVLLTVHLINSGPPGVFFNWRLQVLPPMATDFQELKPVMLPAETLSVVSADGHAKYTYTEDDWLVTMTRGAGIKTGEDRIGALLYVAPGMTIETLTLAGSVRYQLFCTDSIGRDYRVAFSIPEEVFDSNYISIGGAQVTLLDEASEEIAGLPTVHRFKPADMTVSVSTPLGPYTQDSPN